MKRSDMLNVIISILSANHPVNRDGDPFVAEDILRGIELSGMKPPTTRNPRLPKEMCRRSLADEHAKYSVYGYEGPYYDMDYDVNEWDKEE